MCKINMNPETGKQWFPNSADLFTLRDRISRNKCRADSGSLHKLCGFEIPPGNIINFTGSLIGLSFFININGKNIVLLAFALQ